MYDFQYSSIPHILGLLVYLRTRRELYTMHAFYTYKYGNITNPQISSSTLSGADRMDLVSLALHRAPSNNLASNAMRGVLGVGFDDNGARLVLSYQPALRAMAVSPTNDTALALQNNTALTLPNSITQCTDSR